ncbi:MAG: hypothetical protein ACTSRW_17075 [Candidatus Helarchaeota archaeon]
MIKRIGSQTREPIEETEYEVKFRDEHLVLTANGVHEFEFGPDAVLFNKKTGISELWTERDDFAGYVIEIGGVGFEFVRDLK